ncbi:MAG TPA: hypothetical protein VHP11_17330 [Tepidisphaeraceae bacterium]|nr:hypothetical protein [Tepidisphaeraceae bacterium]
MVALTLAVLCVPGVCMAEPGAGSQPTSMPAASQPARMSVELPSTIESLLTEDAETNARAGIQPYRVPLVAKDSPVNLVWRDFPRSFSSYDCTQGMGELTVASPRPAFCKSKSPLLVHAVQGAIPVAFLFDQSKGTGAYDTLYVDFNDNGDFQDDPVYNAVPYDNARGPDSRPVASWFPNVHVRRSGKNRSVHMQVFLEYMRSDGGNGPLRFYVCTIPHRWAVGKVVIAGKLVPVALIDNNLNDSFTDSVGREAKPQYGRITRGDCLVLGEPGSQELEPPQKEYPYQPGSTRIFLTPYLLFDSNTYEVKANASDQGVKLDLVPVSLPMGKMATPKYESDPLILVGLKVGAVFNCPGPQILVPLDEYVAPMGLGGYTRVLIPTPVDDAKKAAASQKES